MFMVSSEMTNQPGADQSLEPNDLELFEGNNFEQSLPIEQDPTGIQQTSAPGQPMFMVSSEMTNQPGADQSFEPNDLELFEGNNFEQSLPIEQDPTGIQQTSAHGQPMFMVSSEMTNQPGADQSFEPNDLELFEGNNFEQSLPIEQDPTDIQQTSAPGQPMFMVSSEMTNQPGADQSFEPNNLELFEGSNFEQSLPIEQDPTGIQQTLAPGQPMFMVSSEMTNQPGADQSFEPNDLELFEGNNFEQSLPIEQDPTGIQQTSAPGQPMFMVSSEMTNQPGADQSFEPNDLELFEENNFEQSLPIEQDPTGIQQTSAHGQPMFMVSSEMTNQPGADQSFEPNDLELFEGNNFEQSLPIEQDPTDIQQTSAPGQPMFMVSSEMTNQPGADQSFEPNNLELFEGSNFEQSLPIEQDPTGIQQTLAPGQPMFMVSSEMTNQPGADQSFEPNDLELFERNNFEQSLPIEQDPTGIQQTSAPGQPMFMVSSEMTNQPGADQSFEPNNLELFEGNNFEQSLPIEQDTTGIQHTSAPGQPMFMVSSEMTNQPVADQSFEPSDLELFEGNNFEQSLPIEQDPTGIQQTSAPGQPMFMVSSEMTNQPGADQSFEPNNLELFEGNNFEQSLPIEQDTTGIQHTSAPGQPMFMVSSEMTNQPVADQSFEPSDLELFEGNNFEQSLPIEQDTTGIQHTSAPGQPMFMVSSEMTNQPGADQSFEPSDLELFEGNNFEQSLHIEQDTTGIQHTSAPGQPMFMVSSEMTIQPGADQYLEPNNLEPFEGNNFEK